MSDLFKYEEEREAASAAKVRALEALLIEKGVLGSDSVDTVLDHFETMAGRPGVDRPNFQAAPDRRHSTRDR
jgi:hypothetical protein